MSLGLPGMGRFSEPALLILLSLASGEKHGHAMMLDIEAAQGVHLGPGTLYGAIMRLESRGLIEALEPNERCRPYRITAAGERALRQQLVGLQQFASVGLERLLAQ